MPGLAVPENYLTCQPGADGQLLSSLQLLSSFPPSTRTGTSACSGSALERCDQLVPV